MVQMFYYEQRGKCCRTLWKHHGRVLKVSAGWAGGQCTGRLCEVTVVCEVTNPQSNVEDLGRNIKGEGGSDFAAVEDARGWEMSNRPCKNLPSGPFHTYCQLTQNLIKPLLPPRLVPLHPLRPRKLPSFLPSIHSISGKLFPAAAQVLRSSPRRDFGISALTRCDAVHTPSPLQRHTASGSALRRRIGHEVHLMIKTLPCQLNKVISTIHFEQQLLNKKLFPQMAIQQILFAQIVLSRAYLLVKGCGKRRPRAGRSSDTR